LVNYIESYQYTKSFRWDAHDPNDTVAPLAEQLRKYDFSAALAVLVPSIPGYHKLNQKHKMGHLKLRQEVARIRQGEANRKQPTAGPIICQFSSIGSLTLKYLHRLAYSMDVARACVGTGVGDTSEDDESKPLKLQLVYPTSDEICNSMEGYRGGNSVPGSLKNVSKNFLNSLWHRWSVQKSFLSSLALTREDDEATSNPLWKGNNVPHIKTYFQLTNDTDEAMEWFVLTSHNLSKAAWGDVQNSTKHNEKRLFCRHWELGVFFSPGQLHARRIVPWSPGKETLKAGDVTVPLPYRHKPVPYGESDKPWAIDQRYVRLDIFGRRCVSDP
jgi:tyrosyl-DNA phosphodiesterase 1